MIKKDTLQRFLFNNAPVRGEYIHLDDSYQTIIKQHPYPSFVQTLLGQALCVAGLLTAIIKFEGRLTVQFRGEGKLKLLVAQCDDKFHLRGLIKAEDELTEAELIGSFRMGTLAIMLDGGPKKERYQGIVPWTGNSLAEAIEGYFRSSEQLATRLWLKVDAEQAAGFMLQVVPSHASTRDPEEGIGTEAFNTIVVNTGLMLREQLLTTGCVPLLKELYPEEDIHLFEEQALDFHCTCSRQRSVDAIRILGQEEAELELETSPNLVVTCDFCSNQYSFTRAEVAEIFNDKYIPPSSTEIH